MKLTRIFSATALFLAAGIPAAFASIQISATRVIYHAAEKNVSVQITNPGKYPVLLQSWTDDGDPEIRPDTLRTPFILTPPLTRVNADAGQTLRLSYNGAALPTDRESVYWLNVLEIPPVGEKGGNQIQVAFRSRIKLFYRPTGLDNKGAKAAISQLRWRVQKNKISLSNPTPYYVSVITITVSGGGKKISVPADMLAPNSSADFTLPTGVTADSVTVDAINDYGASVTAPVSRL
ncbi:molecular chaperone [Salmonella enterica subsp. enterica serovar Teko]|uniref:Fimbrial chaperone protein n=1 Tax=Salmonella enterica subsp. indica TaxID=59207 RepID=A0A379YMU4_SALER|nr:molecular chaperone [Salmonella enterica]EAA7937531.1 molecular chaperone [Salmonella enterica subsp. enterica serovar Teko]EBP3214319.1 molecular chaperone [Salmonella enterica subsp. arizonae]EDV9732141.1 molecular chaperone [Salmonella enterica subsp. enterica]EEC4251023.1 fimbria/pilus periplasmic chaperone [Salmonella enterica subsp. diarizonae]EAA5922551.1 molecular chaperone [Salmonella enterica]